MLRWRPTRYVIVGLTCALANNVVMIAGDWVGIHYLVMSFISFLIVTPLGYVLHSGFTFGAHLSLIGLIRFASGMAAGFGVFLLSMVLLCSGLGLPVAIATPITTVILFVWNYVTTHWAILGRLRFRDLT
jgi:putative flippase GtrA